MLCTLAPFRRPENLSGSAEAHEMHLTQILNSDCEAIQSKQESCQQDPDLTWKRTGSSEYWVCLSCRRHSMPGQHSTISTASPTCGWSFARSWLQPSVLLAIYSDLHLWSRGVTWPLEKRYTILPLLNNVMPLLNNVIRKLSSLLLSAELDAIAKLVGWWADKWRGGEENLIGHWLTPASSYMAHA